MRIFFPLMVLACGGQENVSAQSESTAESVPKLAVSAAQTRPIVRDVVQIPEGQVRMGPRHFPPVSQGRAGTSLPSGGLADKGPPPLVEPAPWVSMGGHGLPPRLVTVNAFVIDRTEVTRRAYQKFLLATGYRLPHVAEEWASDGWNWASADGEVEDPDHPIVMVNYYDAQAYCRWRSMRLPTEAEWQMAALGPAYEERTYPWGSRYDDSALNHGRMQEPNFDGSDGYEKTAPVGSFPKGRSPYGLEDSFGNAWEYTRDFRMDDWRWVRHDGYGQKGSLRNARMSGPGLRVAVRGGSFYFDFRPNPGGEWGSFSPEVRRKSAGFRCAADT